ncbi:MAG: DUF1566 domain-containing protein [Bacteroidota bacterium]
MKKIVSSFAIAWMMISINAQAPEMISYQAVIRNGSGVLITNTEVGMRISILQGSRTGTAVYVETQSPTTNGNGLVITEIGTGNSSDDFSDINWADGPFFIKTETDPDGGSNYSISGTSQLLSVPYALHSKTAERLMGGHYVGELFGGGIVFWVSPDGQHGLIASLDDMEGGSVAPWSNVVNAEIGTDARSMTIGSGNTDAIIGQAGHSNSAAKICKDYRGGGFSDWYLPSLREMHLLASQDILIDQILDNDSDPATNGFVQEYISPAYGRYWSSTEGSYSNAWYYTFSFIYSDNSPKDSGFKVRAIRSF